MNNIQFKYLFSKTSLMYFAIDFLVAILIGFLISILMVILTIVIAGPKFSIAEIMKVAGQIFSPKAWEYDATSGIVFLIPIISSGLSISVARILIKQSMTRKNWVIVTIVIVVIASLVGILSTMQYIGFNGLFWLTPSLIVVMSPIGVSLYLVALLFGISLGIIFTPQKHIMKILVASTTSALISGLFEFIVIGLVLYEAY